MARIYKSHAESISEFESLCWLGVILFLALFGPYILSLVNTRGLSTDEIANDMGWIGRLIFGWFCSYFVFFPARSLVLKINDLRKPS